MRWLIYGSSGFIGRQFCKLLFEKDTIIHGNARVDNDLEVEREIVLQRPDRIVSFIGRTHGGNIGTIDYLEQPGKLVDNVRDNLYGPIILAILSQKYKIHLTYMSTGCIFDGYNDYTEEDKPDFFGSSYSIIKGFTDRIMHHMEYVLNVRIRMPITGDNNPRNFITKIINYEKICSMPNSMTVLPELLPIMLDMARMGIFGTINLTNPGAISHDEILQMYKEIVDPNFTWKNMSLDEQDEILLSKRSNNILSTRKLQTLYPNVLSIHDAVRKTLQQWSLHDHLLLNHSTIS